MTLTRFNNLFGINSTEIDEQNKFVVRINQSVFFSIFEKYSTDRDYIIALENISYNLGIYNYNLIDYDFNSESGLSLVNFTENDFKKTLQALVAFYEVVANPKFHKFYPKFEIWANTLNSYIIKAIEASAPILNLKWVDGIFIKLNDQILDSKIVEDAYTKLIQYDNEQKDLAIAINSLMSDNKYGVVTKCYTALEGLAQKALKNKRVLSNNENELIEFLKMPKHFSSMFKSYMGYAQEYHRHAGENRHNLKQIEVESFLYLTCIFIRLTVERMNTDNL